MACFSGIRHATATQPTCTKRTMFKISIALRLFRYAAPLNKEGNSNMSIETHTTALQTLANGTPDVTSRFIKNFICERSERSN